MKATLGDVGGTLGASGDLCGSVAGGKGGLWMGEVVGSPVGCNRGRKVAGMERLKDRIRRYGGVEGWQ